MIFDRNNSELSVFYELKISPIRFFTESSFLNISPYRDESYTAWRTTAKAP